MRVLLLCAPAQKQASSLRTSIYLNGSSHTLVITRNVWLLYNPYNNSSQNNSAHGIITRGIMARNNYNISEIIVREIIASSNNLQH